jgi:hypothetical protein
VPKKWLTKNCVTALRLFFPLFTRIKTAERKRCYPWKGHSKLCKSSFRSISFGEIVPQEIRVFSLTLEKKGIFM